VDVFGYGSKITCNFHAQMVNFLPRSLASTSGVLSVINHPIPGNAASTAFAF